MIETLSKPWPWYVVGPLIGLMVPLLLLILNKQFGISSSLRHMCAPFVPKSIKYFDYDWKSNAWNLVFVVGVILGAAIAGNVIPNHSDIAIAESTVDKLSSFGITELSGLHPEQIFSSEAFGSTVSLILIILGGFLVGFGTRYANGCTSGHAIMGMSQLSLGSLVATIGFFIGGLIMSWIVLPQILNWL